MPFRASLLLWLVLWTGCYFQPRPLAEDAPRSVTATASTHYRSFADAAALAAYLRHTPDAPRLVSAHRGGPGPGLPENALATFEHTLNYGPALIELDVQMTQDSVLVLMHDDTLDRTTTGSGPVAAHSFAHIRTLRLRDPQGRLTASRVPTFAEALAWAEGRAVLVVEPKRDVPPALVVDAIRRARAENRVVLITYTLDRVRAYYAKAPDLNYSVTTRTLAEAHAVLSSTLDLSRLIAFIGVYRPEEPSSLPERALVRTLQEAGIRVQLGTFGAVDEAASREGPAVYQPLLAQGFDVLATDNVPVATQAVGL